MKLRHVFATVGFGFLTLGVMCGGLMIWESETHTLERHFEAREKKLMAELEPVLESAIENPRLTEVIGMPMERCVRTDWSRSSTPFGSNLECTFAARGPKGDATVELKFKYGERSWQVERFVVTPASEPFKPSVFTENNEWNTPLEDDLEDLDEEIETSVSLGLEEGGVLPPEPPAPPARR